MSTSTAERAPLTRGHKKKARTRAQLLEAALEVLAERGEGFSIGDVAVRAGVSHGTFYNYFADRDALHAALGAHVVETFSAVAARLVADGNSTAIPIDHGNAWSLYFTDPEGNGIECFLDTPFHVAQPYGDALDLSLSDQEIEDATRTKASSHAEFQPFPAWRESFADRLRGQQG